MLYYAKFLFDGDKMKKEEAIELSKDRSRVVIEYIESILSDNIKVTGRLDFSSSKIDNDKMCTLNIYVPEKDFEKHINLGITIDHIDVFYEQLFSDLIDKFLTHETMGLSRYYTIKSGMGQSFYGMNGVNTIGSNIKLNFIAKGQKFDEITSNYNKKINEYVNRISSEEVSKTK